MGRKHKTIDTCDKCDKKGLVVNANDRLIKRIYFSPYSTGEDWCDDCINKQNTVDMEQEKRDSINEENERLKARVMELETVLKEMS